MRTISDITWTFLKNEFESFVDEFFDDPDGMTQNNVHEMAEIYRQLCAVAKDCDTDFWTKVADLHENQDITDYEIERLVDFLSEGGVSDIPDEFFDIRA